MEVETMLRLVRPKDPPERLRQRVVVAVQVRFRRDRNLNCAMAAAAFAVVSLAAVNAVVESSHQARVQQVAAPRVEAPAGPVAPDIEGLRPDCVRLRRTVRPARRRDGFALRNEFLEVVP